MTILMSATVNLATELVVFADGDLLLPFFSTADARELALVCSCFRDAVQAFPWHDQATPVCDLKRWRKCFPQATACLVSSRADMDAVWWALECVRNIRWISFRDCIGLQLVSNQLELFAETESLFIADGQVAGDTDPRILQRVRDLGLWCDLGDEHLAHLPRLRALEVFGNLRITDAGLRPLSQLQTLVLNGATDEYDDRRIATINGLHDTGPIECANLSDAAIAGKPLEYLYVMAINCSFSGAVIGALPLRQLCLRSCPRAVVRTGDLAALTGLDFLCVIDCPNVAVGDTDICQMTQLVQLALINCAAQVTSTGLRQLVRLQMEAQMEAQMQAQLQMQLQWCEIRGCPRSIITGSDYAELSEYTEIVSDNVLDDWPD